MAKDRDLLRAIQEQEYERLGSTKITHVDARIIAAMQSGPPPAIRN
jgi:transcriptional regulator with PAS, ATPase and Fis domain